MEKLCKDCGLVKPIEDFNFKNKEKGWLLAYCKSCMSARGTAWRAANPDAARARRRITYLAKMGTTIEQVAEDMARADGKCPMCGEEAELCIDHNHATGLYRGVICNQCNLMLGHAKDRIDVLQAGIAYLKKHSDACVI